MNILLATIVAHIKETFRNLQLKCLKSIRICHHQQFLIFAMFKITPIILEIGPTFQCPMSILSIMLQKPRVYKIFFMKK